MALHDLSAVIIGLPKIFVRFDMQPSVVVLRAERNVVFFVAWVSFKVDHICFLAFHNISIILIKSQLCWEINIYNIKLKDRSNFRNIFHRNYRGGGVEYSLMSNRKINRTVPPDGSKELP